ncbi:MAG: coiled-coil domain-containing protein [Ignavibacteriaceae bacterium]
MSLFNSKELEQLRNENEGLKTQLHFITEKQENARYLEELLKRLRKEVSQLNSEKNVVQEDINLLKTEEYQKREQLAEFQRRIESLGEMRDELQSAILSYSGKVDGMENYLKEEDKTKENSEVFEGALNADDEKRPDAEIENYIIDANRRIQELNEQEAELQRLVELRKEELSRIEGEQNNFSAKQGGLYQSLKESEEKILSYEETKSNLQKEIESKNHEIKEHTQKLNSLRNEYNSTIKNLSELHEKEKNIRARLEKLIEEEKEKSGLIKELEEFKLELEGKQRLIEEMEEKYRKLTEESSFKEKELYAIDQSLSIKSTRLSKLNLELISLEKKTEELKNETKKYEDIKNDIQQKFAQEREVIEKLSGQKLKLQEIVPLLEKRKKEIEQSNFELEERFTKMFQKFNAEMNAINKKRSVLEQIVLKKEKDIDEKDQMLFEKIASLEESEKILNMRQAEAESIEEVVKRIEEQRENIKNELLKLDEETIEKKSFNSDLRLETELLLKKKIVLEKSLQELLNIYKDSFSKIEEKKNKQYNELKEYEEKLQSYRDQINEAMKELTQLQANIGSIKVEHEDYKGGIAKMISMKKRLYEEILKQQSALQKYQKIREKLKIEQAIEKNKKIGGPYQGEESKMAEAKGIDQKNAQIFKL